MNSANPLTGLIMGSDSELPIIQYAAKVLDDFEISYEIKIISLTGNSRDFQL